VTPLTNRPLRVLVVEDAAPMRALVADALGRPDFTVDEASGIAEARAHIAAWPPDVVLLDLGLEAGDGLDLLRELGPSGHLPVVVLSSRGDEIDRVLGLELGAEDYVVNPFYPRELAARLRRVARRRGSAPTPTRHEVGGLVVDRGSREAWLDGRLVALTDREFDLLAHLAGSPRRVFSRDELLRDVWRSSREWQSRKTVTEHVRRLRQKIERDPARPRWIVTVGTSGYRLEPQ
jgi:two-component system phosphate regulon response regulator PhoB